MNLNKKNIYLKKNKNKKKLNAILYFGNIGLQILSSNLISNIHLNLIKKFFNNKLKKIYKIYFRVNWNKIKTKKSFDSRMGSGKGNINLYVSKVYKGDILFEINTIINDFIIKNLKVLSYKLPFKTRIIYKSKNIN
uniref:50S ribosomal protein L16 n=1 Tax=Nephromyces sp. ex Molgula occidentalis TaxID=2544991 RepID=A0A5C1H7N1_9APIC|nr:50S ribosomal protein L16 [Nephromyces sp. ex Molgula occidentalis]